MHLDSGSDSGTDSGSDSSSDSSTNFTADSSHDSSSDSDSDSQRPPPLSNTKIKSMLEIMVGVQPQVIIDIKELQSFVDRNYLIKINYSGMLESAFAADNTSADEESSTIVQDNASQRYVLKILNSSDSRNINTALARLHAMKYLYSLGIKCCNPMTLLDGELTLKLHLPVQEVDDADDRETTREYIAYLMNYVEGEILSKVEPNLDIFCKVGKYAAVLDGHLQLFCDLIDVGLQLIENDLILQSFSDDHLKNYHEVPNLRTAVIHNDLNDDNLLIKLNTHTNSYDIAGVIDFGDVDHTTLIFELAILIIHMMVTCNDNPIELAGHIISSYHSVLPLTKVEYNGLYMVALARLVQVIVLSEYEHKHSPDNDYVMYQYDAFWSLLRLLWSTSEESVYQTWNKIINCNFDV
ncbi:Hydroxylysine kinase [Trichoplax sp. H2]|nr:Hydroxylysine kinase [Trichoplax sp. H2]|eukprot:RDD42493.1 Hydroxylysine kinase [Trichoplax sp. H2]